jgi:hypothetical protein
VHVPLRRGAWYRVASVTRLEVVLTVKGTTVTVPRPFVGICVTPPRDWTVLRNPTVSARAPQVFRRGYLVCPGCLTRVPLPPAQVAEQLCPRCSQTSPIAWEERYLEKDWGRYTGAVLTIDDEAERSGSALRGRTSPLT